MISPTKSGTDFHKVAMNNASNVGLDRQVKKTDDEVKFEDNDNVTISSNNIQSEAQQQCPVPSHLLTGNAYIDDMIQSGKITKDQLQQLLDLDKTRGEEEQMIMDYQNKSREEMKDKYLNSWVEARKAETERWKTFNALMDYMKQADAAIATNRMATASSIQTNWYKAFFGRDML